MDLYRWSFILCAILTAGVTLVARTGSSGGAKGSVAFGRFQRTFLGVYYIAMTADWLQGPYVYALYSSYGFSKHDIAVLFVGGFGASMVFGTFVGAMADRLGRKRMCQLYCLLYIGSCATKHSSEYYTLMLGRVLGGVATSLLFSSFESWLVCEHNARGYDPQLLGDTFSLMYFGNSLCAIVAGIVAEAAADAQPLTPLSAGGAWHYGGYCSPFDLSAACLFVCLGAITSTWSENYGARSAKGADTASALRSALALMKRDPNIWLIGAVVSLFEGSMCARAALSPRLPRAPRLLCALPRVPRASRHAHARPRGPTLPSAAGTSSSSIGRPRSRRAPRPPRPSGERPRARPRAAPPSPPPAARRRTPAHPLLSIASWPRPPGRSRGPGALVGRGIASRPSYQGGACAQCTLAMERAAHTHTLCARPRPPRCAPSRARAARPTRRAAGAA